MSEEMEFEEDGSCYFEDERIDTDEDMREFWHLLKEVELILLDNHE